jgi:hypothetical protein
MPKGKGTYGSQVGRPPQDARNRSKTTYAGGGELGYEIPQYKEGGSVYERNQAERERIAKANKLAAQEAKEKREERREARKDKREAKPKLEKPKKAGVKAPVMKIPGEQVKWATEIKKPKKKASEPKKKVSSEKVDRKAKRQARQEKRNVRKINRLARKKGMDKIKEAKGYDASKGKPTGRIRPSVKEVTLTEGGAYASYAKKSAPAKSFRKAFASAKQAGKKTFKWDGRSYTTKEK